MRYATRGRLTGLFAAVLALPLLAACGAADDSADGDEDALVVYVGRDEELVGPLIDQFSEETGIEVEARYAGTTDHLATLLEEAENTPADVFLSQDAGALGALADAGMLRELPESITGAVRPAYTSADGTWVGVTGRARVIAYNTSAVEESEVPDSVLELTDDEWAGRVGFPPANASFQAFVTAFRVAEGDEAAQAWLEGMAANDVQTFESNGDTLDAVDRGVVDIGLINHYYLYQAASEVGMDNLDVRLKFPAADDPGALVNVTGAGRLSDDPRAEELIAYLVSETGQQYFVENTFEYPLVESVPAPEGLPGLDEIDGPIDDLADLADLEATIAMIDEAGLS